MLINRHIFAVIGVAEEAFKGFTGGLAFDFWAPMAMYEQLGVDLRYVPVYDSPNLIDGNNVLPVETTHP